MVILLAIATIRRLSDARAAFGETYLNDAEGM